jgi:uncharacterized membrane protein
LTCAASCLDLAGLPWKQKPELAINKSWMWTVMNWYGGSGDVGPLGDVLLALAIVIVIVLTIVAVRVLFPPTSGSDRDRALDILDRRFAAGDLSQAEYEQARRALSQPW